MTIQTHVNFNTILDFFSLPLAPAETYFLDDEALLAAEMSDTLPCSVKTQPLPEIDPDDFESLYQWFLS